MSAGARSWEVLLRGRVEPVALRSPKPRGGQVGGRQSPGSRRGPRPRTWGPVRGAPSLPSPGEAGSAGRRPSGNQPPRPERSGARRVRVYPAPSHARSHTLDAGSGGVPGTLTPAFAPPLGTDAASRWPSPAPQGGGAGAQASPRGGEGARVEPAAAARPWGTRSRPPPRVPPAQCSCARPSLYSGRGSRAVRTQTQRGGSDSGAGPPASGAGERVPEPARPCLSFVAPS